MRAIALTLLVVLTSLTTSPVNMVMTGSKVATVQLGSIRSGAAIKSAYYDRSQSTIVEGSNRLKVSVGDPGAVRSLHVMGAGYVLRVAGKARDRLVLVRRDGRRRELNHRVSVYAETCGTNCVTLVGNIGTGSPGNADGQFSQPFGVDITFEENTDTVCPGFYAVLYVADYGNNRVQKFKANPCFLPSFPGSFDRKWSINGQPFKTKVAPNGNVSATVPGEDQPRALGTIQLTLFPNAGGLTRAGQNLYKAGGASGDPVTTNPGEEGAGTLQGGHLEGGNVSIVEEMVRMITAQRAYEVNSKAIQTADDMLGVLNQLKR